MTSVSLSLVSWNGGTPQTSMYRITPRDQISATHISKKYGLNYIPWAITSLILVERQSNALENNWNRIQLWATVLKLYQHLRPTDRPTDWLTILRKKKVNEWEQDVEFSQMKAWPQSSSLAVLHSHVHVCTYIFVRTLNEVNALSPPNPPP